MRSSQQEAEERSELQYDLYYAVVYNDPDDVDFYMAKGASEYYQLPGKKKSAIELAQEMELQGNLHPRIKKKFGI